MLRPMTAMSSVGWDKSSEEEWAGRTKRVRGGTPDDMVILESGCYRKSIATAPLCCYKCGQGAGCVTVRNTSPIRVSSGECVSCDRLRTHKGNSTRLQTHQLSRPSRTDPNFHPINSGRRHVTHLPFVPDRRR